MKIMNTKAFGIVHFPIMPSGHSQHGDPTDRTRQSNRKSVPLIRRGLKCSIC